VLASAPSTTSPGAQTSNVNRLLTVAAIWIETGKQEQAEKLVEELGDFQAHVQTRGSSPGVEVAIDREFNSLLLDLLTATERWLEREQADAVSLEIGEHTYRVPAPPP
jgi:hypothetical protein